LPEKEAALSITDNNINKKNTYDNAAPVGPSSSSSQPSMIRRFWQVQHRFTGVILIGLAWYNCHTGYVLMSENYDDSEDHTNLFWGVTGFVAGAIILLGYVVRLE